MILLRHNLAKGFRVWNQLASLKSTWVLQINKLLLKVDQWTLKLNRKNKLLRDKKIFQYQITQRKHMEHKIQIEFWIVITLTLLQNKYWMTKCLNYIKFLPKCKCKTIRLSHQFLIHWHARIQKFLRLLWSILYYNGMIFLKSYSMNLFMKKFKS